MSSRLARTAGSSPVSSPVSAPYEDLRLGVFATGAVAAAAASRWAPGGRGWMPWALAAVAIAVWHGAFDGVLAEGALRPRLGRRWAVPFYAGYLALGAGVLLLWWWAPAGALPAFLLYSAFHFGTESERDLPASRILLGTAAGFLPIAAACHWWPAAVAGIFSLLLRGDAPLAGTYVHLAGYVLWPLVAVALAAGWVRGGLGEGGRGAALVGAELLLFRFCPPLAAFAVFFCIWHTPEHLLSTSLDREGVFRRRVLLDHLRRGLGMWLLALLGVGFLCWRGRHDLLGYESAVFLSLSALTVPHMALAEICRRRERSSQRRRAPGFASQRLVGP